MSAAGFPQSKADEQRWWAPAEITHNIYRSRRATDSRMLPELRYCLELATQQYDAIQKTLSVGPFRRYQLAGQYSKREWTFTSGPLQAV